MIAKEITMLDESFFRQTTNSSITCLCCGLTLKQNSVYVFCINYLCEDKNVWKSPYDIILDKLELSEID